MDGFYRLAISAVIAYSRRVWFPGLVPGRYLPLRVEHAGFVSSSSNYVNLFDLSNPARMPLRIAGPHTTT